MSTKFDWQTDDETGWRVEEPISEKTAVSLPRRWPLWIGGVVALLCIGSAIAYSQLNHKVQAITTNAESELLDVHQLVQGAVVDQDNDLLTALLVDDGSDWSVVISVLVSRQQYFDRSPLGLWFDIQTDTNWSESTQITLSPDLKTAELTLPLSYVHFDEEEVLQPVTLQHTAVYKNTGAGWLLDQPDDQFWGNYETEERERIRLVYPARDRVFAQLFVDELAALLHDICTLPTITCPRNFVMELRFDRSERSMLELDRSYTMTSSYTATTGRRFRLKLPAPTLVGTPVDEVGYRALAQGYMAQAAAAMINHFDANCCQFPADQNYIGNQLANLGFHLPKPIGYTPLLVFTDTPIPFPAQDIVTFCRGGFSSPQLVRYNWAENRWDTYSFFGWVDSLAPMENGDGFLASTISEGYQLMWIQGKSRRVLAQDNKYIYADSSFLMPAAEETAVAQHVIIYYEGSSQQTLYQLLDETKCDDAICTLTPLSALPIHSPGKEYTLLAAMEPYRSTFTLVHSELADTLPVGIGFSPIWLGDNMFAYIRVLDEVPSYLPVGTSFVTASVDESGFTTTEYASADFLPYLPADDKAEQIFLGGISKGPEGQLLLSMFTYEQNIPTLRYLIRFDPVTEKLRFFADLRNLSSAVHVGSSPDGRFTGIGFIDRIGIRLRLYDSERDRWTSYEVPSASRARIAWSTDSNWLLLLEEDALHFVAPAHDFDRHVFHEFQGCETAVWVNTFD
jgi:hypothetical protein